MIRRKGDPEGAEPVSRAARRQRVVLVVAVVSAVVSTGGLAAATLVKSPAERAAQTAPPPRTLLTAPVVSRVLSPSTAARAAVYPPTQYNVLPTAASAEVTQLYLSRLNVKPGDRLAAGQLLAEVSGQPLYVLKGAVPAYRDLKPGSSGPDVAELQDALREVGHSSGSDRKGEFGPGTQRAVAEFYRALGYRAPTTGKETRQAVDTAKKAVETDQRTLDSLPAQDPQLAAAKRRLADDREALGRAEAADGTMLPAAHVVFLPVLPATVTAVNASVGLPVSGTLLSITGGGLAVTGLLTAAQAPAVKAGMPVEILDEATGRKYPAVVGEIGAPTSTAPAGRVVPIGGAAPAAQNPAPAGPGANPNQGQGAGSSYTPVTVLPKDPLPAELNGRNVRITIVRETAEQAVTAVPVTAISTDASGRTSITVVAADGQRTTVPVTTGVSADGMVGVAPVDGGALKAGDQVVVGR
ncbi:peptidoglycan-binding protein [Kitasatospora sp. CB01950]|uniref:peptidoglycan-binding protein n=1 Tax=Kitasatospora sp. CB01950 TaxID=1703930 RepID=UPI001161412A|nr:peptidoglycan-binding protein [Kitasatospora sp. CB01950]